MAGFGRQAELTLQAMWRLIEVVGETSGSIGQALVEIAVDEGERIAR